MGSIATWSRKRAASAVTGVSNLVRRHIRISRPAAETTSLMVGAALVVFIVLIVLRRDLWQWIERASWVIALVLFPAAIYQLVVLQRDQRRIADELNKHPDVRVGLRTQMPGGMPMIERQMKISPAHWQPGARLSDVVKVPLSAVNVGNLTAHHVLINLVFPEGIQHVPGKIAAQLRDEPEAGRWRLIFGEHPTVGIGVTIDLEVSVQIGAEFTDGFPILSEVVTQDRPYIDSMVFVGYESPKATP